MRSPAALERALFDRQRAAIEALLGEPASDLKRYEARYRRAAKGPGAPLEERALIDRVRRADAVFVGDYFTFPAAQAAFTELISRGADARPTVLALSCIPSSRQRVLDAWTRGEPGLRELRARLGMGGEDDALRWRHVEPILRFARRRRCELLALDGASESLEDWDLRASSRLARRALQPDRPRLFVLAGQFHVAPCHLPAKVRGFGGLRTLTVYQSLDGLYFTLPSRARAGAIALGREAVCLVSGSPVDSQQSVLELAELEPEERVEDPKRAFERIARRIARTLRVELGDALSRLTVCGPGELVALAEAVDRAPLRAGERAQVLAHALARESGYFPRARLVYLATRSIHHVAEEAAHFVRHVATGDADPARDPFHLHVLEEALAFFAARRVDPDRPCWTLADWRKALRRGGLDAQTAALVLALAQGDSVLPLAALGDRFHEVTHALGYALGDALDRRWHESPRSRAKLKAWFATPARNPRELVAELRRFASDKAAG
jgi:hypothetical protein